MIHCVMEDSFGNLARISPVFNEEKIQEQIGDTLFPYANMMNLKISVS